MYNIKVVSYKGNQQTDYNFRAKSYRRKYDGEKDLLQIFGIQDTIDESQSSTMDIDFIKEPRTSVYVMNEMGKTIDSIYANERVSIKSDDLVVDGELK